MKLTTVANEVNDKLTKENFPVKVTSEKKRTNQKLKP